MKLDNHLANVPMTGRASSPFSELSALSQQRQLSPIYPLPTPLPRVPKDCEAFWKLKEALDRLNAPIPRQPNTVAVRDSGDPKPSDPLNRSKRRADPPTPGPKRVKLSPSVTGSSDFAHSTPGSYNLPLCGLVVFVDSRIDGCSTSEHWGGILRDLGARVCRFWNHLNIFISNCGCPGRENFFPFMHPRCILWWAQGHCGNVQVSEYLGIMPWTYFDYRKADKRSV
jgi:hypothetical protein